MLNVAVGHAELLFDFNGRENFYLTTNSLTEAIGGIAYGDSMDREIVDWDEVKWVPLAASKGGFDFALC